MADFAPNYTARVKLQYQAAGARHTVQFRGPRSTLAAGALSIANKAITWLNALKNYRVTDWTLLGVQWAAADSDLFFDISPSTELEAGALIMPVGKEKAFKALYMQFVGKSTAGSRTSAYLYGVQTGEQFAVPFSDYRILNSEDPIISAGTGVLNETSPALVAADGFTAVWRPYVNIKANDHWVHRARNG